MFVYTRPLPLTATAVKTGLDFLKFWIRTDKSSVCLNLNNISTYDQVWLTDHAYYLAIILFQISDVSVKK